MPDGWRRVRTSLWVPRVHCSSTGGAGQGLIVVARMRPSVTLAQAQEDASGMDRRLATDEPETLRGMRIHLVPFFDELIKDSRQLLMVATAAAFLVLLICCANVSNLLLMRAIVRRSEFATRLAIGARARHLLGVILTESLLLAIGGGVIGAVLARWLIEALRRLSPVDLPRAAAIGHGLQIPIVAGVCVGFAALVVSVRRLGRSPGSG